MKYDVDYYYNLLKLYTPTAQEISILRWDFILQLLPQLNHHLTILDYGSGIGWFSAFKPNAVKEMDTFDIMNVPQTGIKHTNYDVITFWDVLEHIDWIKKPDKKIEDILQKTRFVAITVPILPIGKNYKTWKHRKPQEHLFRFKSIDVVIHFFKERNFKCIKIDDIECPPRVDIYSFLFKKV